MRLEVDAQALMSGRVAVAGSDSRTRTLLSNGDLADRATVVDPLGLQPLSNDQIGEVWIHGPSVSSGYWNRPEENAAAFGARTAGPDGIGPCSRTGDLGFSHDGELFITGRIKDMIIVRGRNHYPQDIEDAATRDQPSWSSGGAAAFGVDDGSQETTVLLLELSRQSLRELAAPDRARSLAEQIARQVGKDNELVLGAIGFVKPGRLMRTSSGKVQRAANRQIWLDRENEEVLVARWHRPQPAAAAPVQPSQLLLTREDAERWLLGELSRSCGLPPHDISLTEPFAAYGLDSLAAVELMEAMKLRLRPDTPLDASALYDYPTIDRLLDPLYADPAASRSEESPGDGQAPAEARETWDLEQEVAALKRLLGETQSRPGPAPPTLRDC